MMGYHMPMSTSTLSSEASLLTIAQQFVQQKQAQIAPPSTLQHQQLEPCSPAWHPEELASHSFYTDAMYEFNPSSSTSIFNDPLHSAMESSASLLMASSSEMITSAMPCTEIRASSSSEYQSMLALEEEEALLHDSSSYDTALLHDVISAEWMDSLMCDFGQPESCTNMACFDASLNLCESSQSSENPSYGCTAPLEDVLPDGFVAVEAAMGSIQQEKACLPVRKSSIPTVAAAGKVPVYIGVQLMQMLLDCARYVDSHNERASALLPQLRAMATTQGDPIQRLAAYFTEALSFRLARAARGITGTRAGNNSHPHDLGHLTIAHKALNDACPYFTFAQLTANQAILEATQGASHIHIVDFGISQGVQWAALLQALAGRPSLARVRITGIASPDLGDNLSSSLAATKHRLVEFGRALDLNVEFQALEVGLADDQLSADMIAVEEDEVVAVNFMLELCNLLDGDDSKVSRVLQVARALLPKVATVAEMDAHLNNGPFQKRFVNALHFFSAMFDSLEAGMSRDCPHRFRMEWWFLGSRVLSMVGDADEDPRRRRLQSHNEWRSAMESAGFLPSAFSHYAVSQARILLWRFCDSFTLSEHEGGSALSLGWQNKALLSVSSWTIALPSSPSS